MATLTGNYGVSSIGPLRPGNISAAFDAYDQALWPPLLFAITPTKYGVSTTRPGKSKAKKAARGPRRSTMAATGPAYSDDFYHKIYVIPRQIELGVFVETSVDFVVWNAYFSDKAFTSISTTAQASDQLALTGNSSGTMPAMAVYDYTIAAGAEGSADLDVTYTWIFSAAVNPTLTLTGQRLILLPWIALTPMSKRLSWKTGVIRAYGQEQRRGLRRAPAQEISYGIHLPAQDRINLESRITNLSSVYAVPLWWDRENVGALTAGATTIAMTTDNAFIAEGGLLYLYESTSLSEAKTIDTITPGLVTLTAGLTNSYTKANVVAALACYARDVNLTRQGNDINFAQFDFISTEFYELPADTYTQYKGLDVLLDPSVAAQPVPMQMVQSRAWRDNGIGPVLVGVNENRVRVQDTQSWVQLTKGQRYKMEQWLQSRYGQRVAFYQPTWQPDFIVTVAVGEFDSFIDVETTDKEAPFEIMLALNDGTQFFREVLTKSVQGGGHRFSLDNTFGQNIALADIKALSVLRLMRHASDSVSIQYEAPNITRAQIPTTTH